MLDRDLRKLSLMTDPLVFVVQLAQLKKDRQPVTCRGRSPHYILGHFKIRLAVTRVRSQ